MTSPVGLHRVLEPAGVLPQAAQRLDASTRRSGRTRSGSGRAAQPRRGELPAAAPRSTAATATAVRAEVLEIIASRGKMQNPVTGSGGMLIGTVDEVGPDSPLGLQAGRPGRHPGLADADPAGHHRRAGRLGRPRPSRCRRTGYAILFGRSIAAVLPDDLDPELALAVLDVCGAPALTARRRRRGRSAAARRADASP